MLSDEARATSIGQPTRVRMGYLKTFLDFICLENYLANSSNFWIVLCILFRPFFRCQLLSNVFCTTYPPVWRDLAKFRHFGKSLRVFGKFVTFYFIFGEILSSLWQICVIIGLIFIVANGQILKNNLTIWSHCDPPTHPPTYLGIKTNKREWVVDSEGIYVFFFSFFL